MEKLDASADIHNIPDAWTRTRPNIEQPRGPHLPARPSSQLDMNRADASNEASFHSAHFPIPPSI
ncbi:hypothetical protein E4U39_006302, partial [Claviceps sp. Clav50 group G5]